MKLFWLMPKRQRRIVREIARRSFINSNGDVELAIQKANTMIRAPESLVTSILVSIAVRLAVELIKYWWENRISEPSANYSACEPGL